MLKLTDQKKQKSLYYLESSKACKLDLTSAAKECPSGRRKIAVKVVDIFGNDTMIVIEVAV
jgi:hypothetical protein